MWREARKGGGIRVLKKGRSCGGKSSDPMGLVSRGMGKEEEEALERRVVDRMIG